MSQDAYQNAMGEPTGYPISHQASMPGRFDSDSRGLLWWFVVAVLLVVAAIVIASYLAGLS